MDGFLKRSKTQIVTPDGKPITLRGVNLGGWLMREAYIMHSPNHPEKHFRRIFTDALGAKAWDEWDQAFNDHFIRESDFKQIAAWGFNCIRVPFHHRVIEPTPYQYDPKGVALLKKVVGWAKKNNLYVILDLHGAAGGQNHDWHSDSDGKAELWTKIANQKRTFALWEFLADQFKNEPTVAGYDVLNESVIHDTALLKKFYLKLVKTIGQVDKNHLMFVEANRWATLPDGLEEIYEHPQTVLSIHSYEPLNITFNFVPHLSYPQKNGGLSQIYKHHEQYVKFSQKHSVPVHVGEFGVNFRKDMCGEVQWLKDMLTCFKDYGFHWNYWTYKAIKNAAFPDGVLSYYPNPPWVHRLGPLTGWNTHHLHWSDKKKEMIQSWHSDEFEVNQPILDCLRHAVKNNKSR